MGRISHREGKSYKAVRGSPQAMPQCDRYDQDDKVCLHSSHDLESLSGQSCLVCLPRSGTVDDIPSFSQHNSQCHKKTLRPKNYSPAAIHHLCWPSTQILGFNSQSTRGPQSLGRHVYFPLACCMAFPRLHQNRTPGQGHQLHTEKNAKPYASGDASV